MFKYLKNVIEEFPEIIHGRAAMPAHDKLFEIRDNEDAKKLNEERVGSIPPHGGQLLFVAMRRARQEIQTAVACLTTRVKNPDEDDRGKLKRVLKYLTGQDILNVD